MLLLLPAFHFPLFSSMKIKESEKPALTRNQTQIANYQSSQSSISAALVVLNTSVPQPEGHSVCATRTSLGIGQKIQERSHAEWVIMKTSGFQEFSGRCPGLDSWQLLTIHFPLSCLVTSKYFSFNHHLK